MILGQLVVIDAVDHGEIGAIGGRGDENALGAGGEMRGRLVLGGENAGTFHRDIDAEVFPGQRRRVFHGGDLDRAVADADGIALHGDFAGEAAMHAVEAQEMRVGFDRPEIVDADHLDIRAAAFGDGAQDIAADAAEPVNGNPDCHVKLPSGTVALRGMWRK